MTAKHSWQEKQRELELFLATFERGWIAFSGGVDSSYLLAVAQKVWGDGTVAVTAVSPSLSQRQLTQALRVAQSLGVEHRLLPTDELENPSYQKNDLDRCYYCKKTLFESLKTLSKRFDQRSDFVLLYGANFDDLQDFRPGHKAAKELGILAPLARVGLTKGEIRSGSRSLGLEVWNAPAQPCLASRIAFGTPVTETNLKGVELAEEVLRGLGLSQFRVRDHGQVARIEVPSQDYQRFSEMEIRQKVEREIRALGYRFVALDLRPFASGRLHEGLGKDG